MKRVYEDDYKFETVRHQKMARRSLYTMPIMYGEEEDIGLTQDDIDRPLTVLDIVRLLSTTTHQSTTSLSHH